MLGIRHFICKLITVLLVLMVACGAALAHPHIWIDARLAIIFNDDGAINAIRHEWTFDQAFSSWSIQGLDTNNDGEVDRDELLGLAAETIVGLTEFEFFTFAGTGETDIKFAGGPNPQMMHDGARITLSYTVVPDKPVYAGEALEIEVTDPEYYVSITFLTSRGAVLENAPSGCSVVVNAPKQIDPDIEDRLMALGQDITELPEDLRAAAADLANVVIVSCPDVVPVVSAEPVAQAPRKRGTPFAAPPAEKGLPVVRTGFLGWVNMQQQAFYGALTKALAQLKTDNNAFWVLGGLSFLYGLFHAAGPGHGKVVISSYVLATKAEVRRGVVLSFTSAMMQSVVAIVLVFVFAMGMNVTGVQLSSNVNIIVIGSYALVTLLGVWLVVRKVFGLGHSHHNHSGDGHDHSHVVTAKQGAGSWREALGVVLAVGLRPCSGALVVLVFALSQQLFIAGIAAVFLMGLGTALTVAVLASMAAGVNTLADRFSGGPYATVASDVIWWLELFGAFMVLGFGVILLVVNF